MNKYHEQLKQAILRNTTKEERQRILAVHKKHMKTIEDRFRKVAENIGRG